MGPACFSKLSSSLALWSSNIFAQTGPKGIFENYVSLNMFKFTSKKVI